MNIYLCMIYNRIRVFRLPKSLSEPPDQIVISSRPCSRHLCSSQFLVDCQPTVIQYWAVFDAGVSVSTEHTLTPTQCRLNVGPASPALVSIHSIPGYASRWLGARDYNALCTHDTPTECRLNVGPPSVTLVYNPEPHCITTHVHQEEDMGLRLPMSSARTKAHRAFSPRLG